jgi:hypothetical protein
MGEWGDYKHLLAERSASAVEAPSPQYSAGRVERVVFPLVSRPHLTNAPWNSQTTIEEANRILSGELKYFSHQFIKTGFPPNWHTPLPTPSSAADVTTQPTAEDGGLSMMKHWSQISDDHVVARRAIVLPDEAIPNDNIRSWVCTNVNGNISCW